MNARIKLNNASIHGALAFAGLIGWLAGSFELFLCIAALSRRLASLEITHAFNIDPNQPHDVGLFVGHRIPSKP